jgi:hypothetical protein
MKPSERRQKTTKVCVDHVQTACGDETDVDGKVPEERYREWRSADYERRHPTLDSKPKDNQ